ncbi:MAG: hypothetical protein PHV03_08380 [Desulfitobacteriaceae bacterium]|nr:hypothetical protein [Desulfitobacteriaceae bacterium]MDD4401935.1 hypothetical protein [Desulfitobacteriaceae bacterium]
MTGIPAGKEDQSITARAYVKFTSIVGGTHIIYAAPLSKSVAEVLEPEPEA